MSKPLPSNVDAERFCLGAVLHNNHAFSDISGIIEPVDFSLTIHRHIYEAMQALQRSGTAIDRLTVSNYLIARGKLERAGGLSTITSLDEGMPDIVSPRAYAQIVRNCAILSRIALVASRASSQALEGGADPSDSLARLQSSLDGVSRELASGDPAQRLSGIIADAGAESLLNPTRDTSGVATGFYDLDERTTGLQPQTLTILAARPSVGKTALMCNMAANIATKTPVAIFSMEMSKRGLIERFLCSEARLNLLKYRSGTLHQEERARLLSALNKINELPIFIDDSSALTHQQITSRMDRMARINGAKVCFLDYIQQMGFESPKAREKTENEKLTEIAESLKAAAKRQNVAVVALSQLSRAPEARTKDHRPMLSDLRSSGGLEQAADLVLFIYRESMYAPDKEHLKDEADLIIGKQRQGPTGNLKLRWIPQYARFENHD